MWSPGAWDLPGPYASRGYPPSPSLLFGQIPLLHGLGVGVPL